MLADNKTILTQLAEQYNIPIDEVVMTFNVLRKLKPKEKELRSDIILMLAEED